MRKLLAILCCIVLISSLLPTGVAFGSPATSPAEAPSASPVSADARYFEATGFRISNDKFWDYFQKRGGITNFGYPVSRDFTLLGTTVQFFQRRVLQILPDGSVSQLNLFDQQFMPYDRINGIHLPGIDDAMQKAAPLPTSPSYATDIVNFVKANAPDTWQQMAVKFYSTFANSVSFNQAFPTGGNQALMPLINFEMWGAPNSQPAMEPTNNDFVFQRFQRGVMHYDKGSGTTQGLLLADYFKSIITGNNLPVDLDQQAAGSPFYKQYNNAAANGLNRPDQLPNTNMKDAFEKQGPVAAPSAPPTLPTTGAPAPTATSGLRYGMQADMLSADKGRTLDMLKGAGFGWLKQQVRWEIMEGSRGQYNWGITDPIVDAASAAGVKVLFSVVTSPGWARADGKHNAPPDNPADFANFMGALAERYKGRVHAYEVWNEENLKTEWDTGAINAGQYVELLKAVYPRIKAADPNAVVIAGALTPTGVNDGVLAIDDVVYMQQMYAYQGGVIKTVCDAIGAHMAGFCNAPGDWVDVNTTGATSFTGHPSFYFRRIDQLHNVMAAAGDNKQLWITEYEWASASPPVPAGYEWTTFLSEDQVASFYVQGIQMIQASRPWVGAVFVWNLNWRTFADYHQSEQALFGILNPDWSPRQIYVALRDMPK